MTYACEWCSQMQSIKILCLSLLFTQSRMEFIAGRIFFAFRTGHLGSGCAASSLLLQDTDTGLRMGRCCDGLSRNEALLQLGHGGTVAHWQVKRGSITSLYKLLCKKSVPFQRYDPDWSETGSGLKQGTKAGYWQPDEPLQLSLGSVCRGMGTAGPHRATAN